MVAEGILWRFRLLGAARTLSSPMPRLFSRLCQAAVLRELQRLRALLLGALLRLCRQRRDEACAPVALAADSFERALRSSERWAARAAERSRTSTDESKQEESPV